MNMRRPLFILLLALLSASSALAALTPQQRLAIIEEAQQSYDRGIETLRTSPTQAREAFRIAAERFQLVADDGVSNGRLLYNLGNAYLQSGDLGHAILNYRRAEQFMPGDARLRSNLDFARSLSRSKIESSGASKLTDAVLGWHQRLPLRWRFGTFIAAHITLWLSLASVVVGLARFHGFLKSTVVAAAVIWLLSGISVASDLTDVGRAPAGVLIADDVVVRKGNGTGFEPLYEQPLHAGVEFTLLHQRGEWLEIRLPNQAEGWIEAEKAGLLP